MPSMRCLFAALTCRMHRWPILCQCGDEIGLFAEKRSHVDVRKAVQWRFRVNAARCRRLAIPDSAATARRYAGLRERARFAAAVTNRKCQDYQPKMSIIPLFVCGACPSATGCCSNPPPATPEPPVRGHAPSTSFRSVPPGRRIAPPSRHAPAGASALRASKCKNNLRFK